jgi:anti-sigma factor RsiW
MSRDERTLHAYHDGELRGLGRWRFERRLSRSPELRTELEALRQLAVWTRECEVDRPTADLWDHIALRLPAIDAQRAEPPHRTARGFAAAAAARPLTALALTGALALALFLGIIRDGSTPAPGVISWLDTGGRSVMVLEDQGGATTIVWLLDPATEGASVRGTRAAV